MKHHVFWPSLHLQSRYVGYYEVMKSKFNRQLPPPQSLKIKSLRIHSIAGRHLQTSPHCQPVNAPLHCTFRLTMSTRVCVFTVCMCAGVGKGNGSDLKVKIIVRKELVFQCVCAKQENCKVGQSQQSQPQHYKHTPCTAALWDRLINALGV